MLPEAKSTAAVSKQIAVQCSRPAPGDTFGDPPEKSSCLLVLKERHHECLAQIVSERLNLRRQVRKDYGLQQVIW